MHVWITSRQGTVLDSKRRPSRGVLLLFVGQTTPVAQHQWIMRDLEMEPIMG